MTTLVADAAVVGVVGPFNSSVAKVQIPISNEAGLLQCSPANTNPDLTKGDAGKELRAKNPDKINYVRVATTDDIQGPAVAQYGVQKLGLKKVAIIDDTETYGKGLADAFEAEWKKLGGDGRRSRGRPEGHHRLHRDPDQVQGRQPRRRLLRRRDGDRWRPRAQADAAGRPRRDRLPRRRRHPGRPRHRRTRLVHQHRRRGRRQLASAPSPRSPSTRARPTSTTKYKAEYGVDAGAYSASGYACAQVVLEAIKTAAAKGDVTREAVRAAGADTTTTFETVLGPVKFDAVGDTSQKIISLYKVDLTAADGKGDWVFDTQVDYGK